MPVRGYLYDASGIDKAVDLSRDLISSIAGDQLLWVDIEAADEKEIRQAAEQLGLGRESIYNLVHPERRPRLDNYGSYMQLNVNAIQDEQGKLNLVSLNFITARNLLVTVHQEHVEFLEHFSDHIKGDSTLGRLDSVGLLAALLDWHLTSFFRVIEQVDSELDRLDGLALRPVHGRNVLRELSHARQRIGLIRRLLTPHREVYAAMVRPDFHLLADSDHAAHYALLNDRLERAVDLVESARELLVGTFDIFTTQTTLRTNEEIKVLTLASVILLPANLIIAFSSLLMRSPVHPRTEPKFWIMLCSILLFAATAGFVRSQAPLDII